MIQRSILLQLLTGCFILTLVLSSCQNKNNETPEDLRFKVEDLSWEEHPSAEGCKISVTYPINNDQLSLSVKEWMNEVLGGTYHDSLENGKKMIEYYGKAKAEEINEIKKEFGESPSINASCYYIQIKKVFETEELVSFTSEIYEYSGGAHGGESLDGAIFRKIDGKRFGWDMFTDEGKEKLRGMIKEDLKKNYFKVSSDDDFYNQIFDENARNKFPLPAAAPIFKKHGVTFIYQQYEIAAYAVGMPKCSFTYEQILNLCTSTAQPLIQSTNDFIAKTLPYGKQY